MDLLHGSAPRPVAEVEDSASGSEKCDSLDLTSQEYSRHQSVMDLIGAIVEIGPFAKKDMLLNEQLGDLKVSHPILSAVLQLTEGSQGLNKKAAQVGAVDDSKMVNLAGSLENESLVYTSASKELHSLPDICKTW
ncbi:hypothetical protein NDU88_005293 [Pleurodeles waltl]|uniref:Uncharacterized protein n=1 Tax=Pleurodeles waltl TaxID=8319 RepID=A0AAV7SL78_PLEWA|nr:hypothetical protein NDU88_005293 [Pleurodeles waltl]